jgi:hypothetical protein
MTSSRAHSAREDEVLERPVLGWVEVLVHAMEPGQCEIRVRWPDDARSEDAAGAATRERFARFVIAELEADLTSV